MQLNPDLRYILFGEAQANGTLLLGISQDGCVTIRDYIHALRNSFISNRTYLFASNGILHAAKITSGESIVIWKIGLDQATLVAAYRVHSDGNITDNKHKHPRYLPHIQGDIERFIYANSCNCICFSLRTTSVAYYIYIDITTWNAKIMGQSIQQSVDYNINASYYDHKKDIHYFNVPTAITDEKLVFNHLIVCPTSRIHRISLGYGVFTGRTLAMCGSLAVLKTQYYEYCVYSMDSSALLSHHSNDYFCGSLWISDSVHAGLFRDTERRYSIVYSQHADGTTYTMNVDHDVSDYYPIAFFCGRLAPRSSNCHRFINASLHSRARL